MTRSGGALDIVPNKKGRVMAMKDRIETNQTSWESWKFEKRAWKWHAKRFTNPLPPFHRLQGRSS